MTYANAAARELLGREPGEIVGTPCTAYVHPDDLTKTHEAWERVAAGERVCGAQLRVRHRDGRSVPVLFDAAPRVDAAGHFVGLHAIVRGLSDPQVLGCGPVDLVARVAELQEALERVRQREESFRDIIDQLPCVVYVAKAVWPPVLEFISANVEQLMGLAPDAARGNLELGFERIHPDDREAVRHKMRANALSPEPYSMEFRVGQRDGKGLRHAVLRSMPVCDASGRVLRRQGIIVDVTEQKALEEELRHAQRLAAIGEMAAMMAHEIRNPLAGMSLCLRLLRECAGEPESTKECLDDIEEGLRRINGVVSRALDFARSYPPELHRCSLREILGAAERLTAAYARQSNVELTVDIPDGLPQLVADPTQMEQLFVNLILNACKAMPDGGRLAIRARASADRLVAEVADTGIGIEPDQLEQIFNPFYSGFGDSTGLGLSFCQRIAAAHGGQIRVQSAPGRGTTFRVELPLGPGHVPHPAD